MAIDSGAGPIAGRSLPAASHDHDHAAGHDQGDAEVVHGDAHLAVRPGFSPFLASALDRLALAVVVVGLIWIGVFWAVQ